MRILSGIQSSGVLHVGNYFGMMQPSILLQNKGDAFYFIADYHALTSVHDKKSMQQNVQNVALDFLACGLDPSKCVFFRQSAVPEVHELAWYLSVVTPMGLLERCHSYKDKIARGVSPNHGLFAYPVLMAADILLYDAAIVPVGQDQKQHLEVTRDVAQKFNDLFGPVFHIPEASIKQEVAVIPGIDGQKMSKSYNNTIEIFSEEAAFRKKVMAIKTDSTPVESPKPIDDSIILALVKCVTDEATLRQMISSMQKGGVGYGEYKKQLFSLLWDYFAPFRTKRQELQKNSDYIDQVLKEGGEKARTYAAKTLQRVRQAVGIAL